jgi:hypothetical protein
MNGIFGGTQPTVFIIDTTSYPAAAMQTDESKRPCIQVSTFVLLV